MATDDISDMFIIGGGVNGCGIARDAAGRGLSVTLAEMNDLASATSSASTKLFHGGLRYLEYLEIRLVREALREREVLLAAMPHIAWPMRFVLPLTPDMRFDSDTPISRMLRWTMPWLRGKRPGWIIRMGLFLYDHLGGRKILPGTSTLDLASDPAGAALKPGFGKAFEYSDCCVQDARLVVLNARDAARNGATVLTRTKVIAARREDGLWAVETEGPGGTRATHRARMLVNAGGPWVSEILHDRIHVETRANIRLVRGSHVVTRRLFDHDRCYFLQGPDGRIVFAIPFEDDFTMIGTTEESHPDPDTAPVCTEEEKRYLLDFVSQYFREPVREEDIVWSFSGVRPLYDDGASSATAATRDYVLKVNTDENGRAPVLDVFGGKITTYRRLAEVALQKAAPFFAGMKGPWTAGAPLPGGDFPVDGLAALIDDLRAQYGFLSPEWARRLVRGYGTEAAELLAVAQSAADLGEDFGATLSEAELRWLMTREFARTAEDVVWRRTKLGLRMSADEIARLDAWMAAQAEGSAR